MITRFVLVMTVVIFGVGYFWHLPRDVDPWGILIKLLLIGFIWVLCILVIGIIFWFLKLLGFNMFQSFGDPWLNKPHAREWIAQVRNNRRRHPDLIRREEEGEDRFSIAQKMMMRDRDAVRSVWEKDSSIPYPDVWDYYIPTNHFEMVRSKVRRAERRRDIKLLRQT